MLSDKAKQAKADYNKKNHKTRRENRTPEQIKKDSKYQKEWRHKNRDKVKAYGELYWERRAFKNIGFVGDEGEIDSTFFDTADSFKTKVETKISDEFTCLGEKEIERLVIGLHENSISLRVTAKVLGISHMRVSRILARQKSA